MTATAGQHFGVSIGSVPWLLITVVLVAFVVYRAWRGARRQVSSAVAAAVSEARAQVDAELHADARAQSNVVVHVGDSGLGRGELQALVEALEALPEGERRRLLRSVAPARGVDGLGQLSYEGGSAVVE